MSTPHRLFVSTLLILLFALTTIGGDMDTPKATSQLPVANEVSPASDIEDLSLTIVAFDAPFAVVQSVLSIF